jgi:hypothetical protein
VPVPIKKLRCSLTSAATREIQWHITQPINS